MINSFLPPACQDHCTIAAIKDRTLLVYVDNPIWADLVRLREKNILNALNQSELVRHTLEKLEVKVHSSFFFEKTKKADRKGGALSAKTAQLISETAQDIGDSKLKEALERLASRNQSSDA